MTHLLFGPGKREIERLRMESSRGCIHMVRDAPLSICSPVLTVREEEKREATRSELDCVGHTPLSFHSCLESVP